jgi:riboflavin kinase / FMN adenylyltransferase
MEQPNHQSSQASVVVPGNHDGVHLGHRALIHAALQIAQPRHLRTIAFTFDPHPTNIFAPDRVPPLLTTPERRVELLRKVGADEVIVQAFDSEFAALAPEAFFEKRLVNELSAKALVVGPDFGFGAKRSGNVDTLRALGERYGISLSIVPPVMVGDQQVSSSAVRRAICAGEVERATELLGRAHEVCGRVIEGDRRGRTLGIPTANLDCEPVLKPLDGVYAVMVRQIEPPSDTRYQGVANIGLRPTFGRDRSVEIHLLDTEGDFYRATLRVAFISRLRGVKAFSEVDQLVAQIRRDISLARDALNKINPGIVSWI